MASDPGGRPTTYTADLAAKIIGARRVGATLREAAGAAGVPHRTAFEWLARGRRWNEGDRANVGDANYSAFAEAVDAAPGLYMSVLRSRVAAGTAKDARLAFDVVRHRETSVLRNQELRLLKARSRVEENRADGTHVERVDVVTRDMTDEDIIAEARRLAAEIEGAVATDARGEAPTAH